MVVRLGSAILVLALYFWNPYPFQLLELKSFDWLMMSQKSIQNENILLVDIDEEIIKGYKGYPLPRTFYAQAISRASGVTGITVLMPDPDIRGKEHDTTLASALRKSPAVLAFVASTQANEGGPHVGTAQIGGDPHLWLYRYPGILRQEHLSTGVGLINTTPEIDGVVRRIPLAVGSQDKIYPSFALEMLRVGVGDPSYQIKTTDGGIEWVRVPNYPPMYTDSNAQVWLNYNVNFYRQSASEFMNNPIDAPFIIFGVTAEGIVNPVPTPAGLKYPHELQANLLHNLIQGTSPSTPEWGQLAEMGTAVGLIILLLITSYSIILSLPALLLSIAGLLYATWNLFQSSYLFDVSAIIIICFLYWSIVTFRNFVQQFILRRRISQQFGTYVSPSLVKKLQDNPKLLRLGGVTKRMTFLFSDIRGFTPISEKYQSKPQGLTTLINRFLDNQTEIILKHGGTIDKYMGDCIMAFWNAPLDCEEQERKATECALEMRKALGKLNEQLREEALDEIKTGAGINTGPCVVGNFGSSSRFDYSVLGDAVNLAARLESQCKEYGVDLIISEYSRIEGFVYKFLDEITVKGKSEPVKIYTIEK